MFKKNYLKINEKAKKALLLAAFILGFTHVFGQSLPPISNFYTPNINQSNIRNLSPGDGDDSGRMQNAIDELNNSGGGILRLAEGEYQLREVVLKSNVHIEINPGAVIQAIRRGSIFLANRSQEVSNFSIISSDRAENRTHIRRFMVDLTALNPGDGLRVIRFSHAENFRIADFEIKDNLTRFASFAFLSGVTNGMVGTPREPRATTTSRGIIENSNVTNAIPGWGLVQVQTGNNLLFRRISGTGGVTLRLESGGGVLQQMNTANRALTRMDRIYARRVSVTNGRSALSLSPHTRLQGFVDIRNITSISSEFAVTTNRGFRSSSPNRGDQSDLPFGTFTPAPIVRNISATFGNDAQIRTQETRFIPCALRVPRENRGGIISGVASSTIESANNFRVGPAIAPVLNGAPGGGDGSYPVNLSLDKVKSIGFRSEVVDVITVGGTDDFEDCAESLPGIGFVRRDERNTPNPRNPRENSGSKLVINSEQDMKIFPNPAVDSFNVTNLENSNGTINIFTLGGKLIKVVEKLDFNDGSLVVDVSDLSSGLYFVKYNSKTLKLNIK